MTISGSAAEKTPADTTKKAARCTHQKSPNLRRIEILLSGNCGSPRMKPLTSDSRPLPAAGGTLQSIFRFEKREEKISFSAIAFAISGDGSRCWLYQKGFRIVKLNLINTSTKFCLLQTGNDPHPRYGRNSMTWRRYRFLQ